MEELLAHYDKKIEEMERNGEFVHPHFREARDIIAVACDRIAALEAAASVVKKEAESKIEVWWRHPNFTESYRAKVDNRNIPQPVIVHPDGRIDMWMVVPAPVLHDMSMIVPRHGVNAKAKEAIAWFETACAVSKKVKEVT